jgi:hypothetical protein
MCAAIRFSFVVLARDCPLDTTDEAAKSGNGKLGQSGRTVAPPANKAARVFESGTAPRTSGKSDEVVQALDFESTMAGAKSMRPLLDNIIWNTLRGLHARFAAGPGDARRYARGLSAIGGLGA